MPSPLNAHLAAATIKGPQTLVDRCRAAFFNLLQCPWPQLLLDLRRVREGIGGSVANGAAGLVRWAECERTGHRCSEDEHFQDELIVLCVRWYLRYSLSYRDLEEMMAERGLSVDHSTIARWVFACAPILNERMRRHLRNPNRS